MGTGIDLSVIIPVGRRHDDARVLFEAYREGLDRLGLTYEVIFVLDGKYPKVLKALQDEQRHFENLYIAQLSRPFGKTTAIAAGFEASRGGLIMTLPAYFQVDPAEFEKVLSEKGDYHMITGHRWPRKSSGLDRFRRRVFHRLLHWVTGQRFRDLGCGVRLFEREVLEEINLYGDQHRFLPLIVERSGFKVLELDVRQSELDYFAGHYSVRDYLRRLLDVFTVFFLVRFTKKPLRFFGTIGVLLLLLGAGGLGYVLLERLFFGQALADRPALLLGALLTVLGAQIMALGLLGELIIFTHARSLKEYKIEHIVNPNTPGVT